LPKGYSTIVLQLLTAAVIQYFRITEISSNSLSQTINFQMIVYGPDINVIERGQIFWVSQMFSTAFTASTLPFSMAAKNARYSAAEDQTLEVSFFRLVEVAFFIFLYPTLPRIDTFAVTSCGISPILSLPLWNQTAQCLTHHRTIPSIFRGLYGSDPSGRCKIQTNRNSTTSLGGQDRLTSRQTISVLSCELK